MSPATRAEAHNRSDRNVTYVLAIQRYYASALESYVWMVVPSKAWYRCMNETSVAIAIAQTVGTMIETQMNSVVLDTYTQCTAQCAFHDM